MLKGAEDSLSKLSKVPGHQIRPPLTIYGCGHSIGAVKAEAAIAHRSGASKKHLKVAKLALLLICGTN